MIPIKATAAEMKILLRQVKRCVLVPDLPFHEPINLVVIPPNQFIGSGATRVGLAVAVLPDKFNQAKLIQSRHLRFPLSIYS